MGRSLSCRRLTCPFMYFKSAVCQFLTLDNRRTTFGTTHGRSEGHFLTSTNGASGCVCEGYRHGGSAGHYFPLFFAEILLFLLSCTIRYANSASLQPGSTSSSTPSNVFSEIQVNRWGCERSIRLPLVSKSTTGL